MSQHKKHTMHFYFPDVFLAEILKFRYITPFFLEKSVDAEWKKNLDKMYI